MPPTVNAPCLSFSFVISFTVKSRLVNKKEIAEDRKEYLNSMKKNSARTNG